MKKTIGILLMLLMVISLMPLAFAENETQDEDVTGDNETLEIPEDGNETESEDAENETESEEENETEVVGNETETEEENETEEEVEDESEEEEVEPEEVVETVDEDTEEEVLAMSTNRGAEIRLLQLEKAILRNIESGELVIATAEEAGADTADLAAVMAELEALKAEVEGADPGAEDAVKVFVELKSNARDLSKQFREAAKDVLSAKDIAKAKQKIKEKKSEKLGAMQNRIANKVRAHNAEQLAIIQKTLGIEDADLVEQLENGEITPKEAKVRIREALKSISKDEKKEAFAELKEAGIKKKVVRKAAIEKVKKAKDTSEDEVETESEETEDVPEDEEKSSNGKSNNGKKGGKE